MVMRLERWLYAKNIGRKLHIGTSEQVADEVFQGNLRSGSIFVSLSETFRHDGRNEK